MVIGASSTNARMGADDVVLLAQFGGDEVDGHGVRGSCLLSREGGTVLLQWW